VALCLLTVAAVVVMVAAEAMRVTLTNRLVNALTQFAISHGIQTASVDHIAAKHLVTWVHASYSCHSPNRL
jgi:hypothetical protein